MHCHRNSLTAVALMVIMLAQHLFSHNVLAQGHDEHSKIVEFYIKAAFSNKDKVLKRFPNKSKFNVAIVCVEEDCDKIGERPKVYLPEKQFELKFPSQLSGGFDLTVLILSDKDIQKNEIFLQPNIFSVSRNEVVARDGVDGCASFSKIHPPSSEIRQIAVSTVRSDNSLKITACVLMQIIRGTGLNFSSTFSEFWETVKHSGGPDSSESNKIMMVLSMLIAIHFNENTRPGMTKFEAISVLSNLTLDQLRGLE